MRMSTVQCALLLAFCVSGDALADSWRSVLASHRATPGPGGTIVAAPQGGGSYGERPVLAADAVVYASMSTDLVDIQADDNGGSDVFLFDLTTGRNTLVSHAADAPNRAANGHSRPLSASSDGRWILFASTATDLIGGQQDSNGAEDLFLYDRTIGTSTLISHSAGTATTTGNGRSHNGKLTPDGRWVAFNSEASDLVASVLDGNGQNDTFILDRLTGATALVSHSVTSTTVTADAYANLVTISDDGRWVVMESSASDFPGAPYYPYNQFSLYMRDNSSGASTQPPVIGEVSQLSADGSRFVVLSTLANPIPGVNNPTNKPQAYFYDRAAAPATLLSHAWSSPMTVSNDSAYHGSISADGEIATFRTSATDILPGIDPHLTLYNVYLFERSSGQLRLVSHAATSELVPGEYGNFPTLSVPPFDTLSGSGDYVTYVSVATNLVAGASLLGGTNLYIYDRATRSNRLVSSAAGLPTSGGDGRPDANSVSADGRIVAFNSTATNLAEGTTDDNGVADVYVAFHQYAIVVTAGPGGSVTPMGTLNVDAGRVLSVHVAADPGHVTTIASSCGGVPDSNGDLTTSPLGQDCHITIAFPLPDAVFRDDFE